MGTKMDDKTQKRVQTVISLVIAMVHRRADTRTQGREGRFARSRLAGGGEDDGVLRGLRARTQVSRDAALNPGQANAHSVGKGLGELRFDTSSCPQTL
jgi:hypothetical protein